MYWIMSLLISCSPLIAQDKFDSQHSILVEAVIPDGEVISNNPSMWSAQSTIEDQLLYTIGQLNGLEGGAPDTSKTELEIKDVIKLDDNSYKIKYAAKLFVAWPREQTLPNSFEFYLPRRADYIGLNEFYNLYGADERGTKKCLAWEAHEVTNGIFWYYYRPLKSSCPLRVDGNSHIIKTKSYLSISKLNTENKYPEYEKIWEDKKLVITAIFGKAEEGSTSNYDAGASAYVETVNELIRRFGMPSTSSYDFAGRSYFSDGIKTPEIFLTFETDKGIIDAALFLIEGIRSADGNFTKKFNQRTLNSDFVSYSGHSGLGANIRALARMGKFQKGQYQIFLINGCDTFAYVDESLTVAHAEVNPEFSGEKFIDLITNAMPSYFHMNARSNMAVIDSLFGETRTYKEILSLFDPAQRAVVTGEEDNRWPESFY